MQRHRKVSEIKPGTWNYIFFMAAQELGQDDTENTFTTNDLINKIRSNEDLASVVIGTTPIGSHTTATLKKRSNTYMNRLLCEFRIVMRDKGGVGGVYTWVGQEEDQ